MFVGQQNQLTLLPLAFRDVVKVVKLLGLRYLWVDALCIIQDSPEDWEREASRMSAVYGGSALNIAAAASTNPNESIFRERIPRRILPIRIKIPHGEDFRTLSITGRTYFKRSQQAMTVVKRGWVVQELFLAPQNLVFGFDQVFWECNRLAACEVYPEGIPVPTNLAAFSITGFRNYYSDGNGLCDPTTDKKFWGSLIENFTKCRLSFSKDKLPALAGIAKYIQLRTGDQYLAGLWRSMLSVHICWLVKHEYKENILQVDKKSGVPTWSWASIDLPVNFYHDHADFIKVLSANVTTNENMPLGSALGGELRLKAIVFEASVLDDLPSSKGYYCDKVAVIELDGWRHEVQLYFDTTKTSYEKSLIFLVALYNRVTGIVGLLLNEICSGASYKTDSGDNDATPKTYVRHGYFETLVSSPCEGNILGLEEDIKFDDIPASAAKYVREVIIR